MSSELFAAEIPDVSVGYSTEDLLESHTGNLVAIFMFCLKLCIGNIKCLSIFYNQSQQKCLLSAAVFFHSNSPSFILEQGWRHYRTSGDMKCDVSEGFIHNRELGMCYSIRTTQADWLQSSFVCSAMNGHLVKVDSSARLHHLNKTINAMSVNVGTLGGNSNGDLKYHSCWPKNKTDCIIVGWNSAHTPEECAAKCETRQRKFTYLESNRCGCCDTLYLGGKLDDDLCSKDCGSGTGRCSLTRGIGAIYTTPDAVDFYIGLKNVSTSWKWSVDGTVVGFTGFDDTRFGSCAVMTSAHGFRWKAVPCTNKAGSICEITLN